MIPYSFQIIHTLEARSNLLLEVTQQHLKLSDPQVFQMIQALLQPTVEILRMRAAASVETGFRDSYSQSKARCVFRTMPDTESGVMTDRILV